MARKTRNNYNIDTLRLCFKHSEQLFQLIAETKVNTRIPRDGYYLFVLGDEDENDEEMPKSITCNVVSDDNTELGTMTFNKSGSKYGGYCFFRFCNTALYHCISVMNNKKGSLVHCIGYIMDDLGLEFVSITELHIANDTNINKIARFLRYKTDRKNYDVIVNRRKVNDVNEKISGYHEEWQSTRTRRKNPTLYFKQKKLGSPKLCMYNKTIEIAEESGKRYIEDWNDFGRQTIFRAELRLHWDYIKEYFAEKGLRGVDIVMAILRNDILEDMFSFFSSRLVYIKNKRTNEALSINNIA